MSDDSSAPPAAQSEQPVSASDSAKASVSSNAAAANADDATVNKASDASAPAAADPVKGESAPSDSKPSEAPSPVVASSEKPTTSSDTKVDDADAKPDESAKDATEGAVPGPEAAAPAGGAVAPATPASTKKAQRKSIGGGQSTGKKLNKKQSKAKITHLDAKPGDYFFVKLKGWPQWPAIIADEDMLPETIIRSRPVTAANEHGVYRQDFADGGKKVADRTFPVMYMGTNEFGWVPNTDLVEFDVEEVKNKKMDKVRKDLANAHEIALQQHDLNHFKTVLINFQEDLLGKQQEQEAKEAKAAAKAAKKARKSQAADDEDVEMKDAADDAEDADAAEKKSKKRKAEEDAGAPQRSDSVKKPKIKVISNSTPKSTNGTPSAKASKASAEPKASKPKAKKSEDKKEPAVPKEPELSPEEKHIRKEKEVLFLRHKLQKGLLTRDQEPKEDEMKLMSDYITKLEGFPDLEVSIIRATKINKVLKAILKLDSIPKEDEFQFKPRSQALLDKWNKLLAVDAPAPPAASEGTNGINGTQEKAAETNSAKEVNGAEKPVAAAVAKVVDVANGVKDKVESALGVEKSAGKGDDGPKDSEEKKASSTDEASKEVPKATEPIDASA